MITLNEIPMFNLSIWDKTQRLVGNSVSMQAEVDKLPVSFRLREAVNIEAVNGSVGGVKRGMWSWGVWSKKL